MSGLESERFDWKSLDGQLLWELENGFELSPRESELILETIRLYYHQAPDSRAGRVSLWVVEKDSSVGKPLDELGKVQVWVTLDGGQDDLETYESYGHTGLRRQKILRVAEEIVDQGGIATQEDLSRLLGASLRTIRRDISYLRQQGLQVLTRGVYADIGPSVSHKVIIVEMYLSGFVYTEICRRTGHSAKAVKRYVNTFGRVVVLHARGIVEPDEISTYVGVSSRLASEYLEIYFKLGEKSGCKARINDLLQQLSSRPDYPGVDKSGMKKKAGSGCRSMKGNYSNRQDRFASLEKRSFRTALIRLLETEYKLVGSRRVLSALADDIEHLQEEFFPRSDRIESGTVAWVTTKKTVRKPSYGKRTEDYETVMVYLPLITQEDLDKRVFVKAGTKNSNYRVNRERDLATMARLTKAAWSKTACFAKLNSVF